MEVYDFKFEQIEEEIIESEKDNKNILNANVKMEALIGKSKMEIGDIIKLEVDDVITLDKNIDEKLEIYINNQKIAQGETVILDNKIAVRISDSKYYNDEI